MADRSEAQQNRTMKRLLLILNCVLLSIGTISCPLIMRLYFIHGGQRVWLSSWIQSSGFPIILIPLAISYFYRRHHSTAAQSPQTQLVFMKPPLFFASVVIGILSGLGGYLIAYGVSRLPVSTAALITASQLAFTAVFAFFLVRQKFNFYSINAVALLTIGAGVLALRSSGDRPAGESTKQYVLGFVLTLAAAALNGFISPLVEWVYRKAKQNITYTLVLEIQLIICVAATIFCTVGMLINNDFKAIPREARNYGLGETKYYVVLVCSAIISQAFFLGVIGVVFSASSLLSGVVISLFLPLTEILAVLFYKEKFRAEKGVALVLSLWGFVSYFYGEIKQSKRNKIRNQNPERELPQTTLPNP